MFFLLMNSYADDCSMHRSQRYQLTHDGTRVHVFVISTNPDGTTNDVEIATNAVWWREMSYDHAQCVSMQITYCP